MEDRSALQICPACCVHVGAVRPERAFESTRAQEEIKAEFRWQREDQRLWERKPGDYKKTRKKGMEGRSSWELLDEPPYATASGA